MQDNPRLHHLEQPDDLDSPLSREFKENILFINNYSLIKTNPTLSFYSFQSAHDLDPNIWAPGCEPLLGIPDRRIFWRLWPTWDRDSPHLRDVHRSLSSGRAVGSEWIGACEWRDDHHAWLRRAGIWTHRGWSHLGFLLGMGAGTSGRQKSHHPSFACSSAGGLGSDT